MGKMNTKLIWKIGISAIFFVVVAQIVHTLGAYAGMKYYFMEEYFPVWSKIMMPKPGPPPVAFTLLSIGLSLLTGLVYAIVYATLSFSVPGKTLIKKGLCFGLILFFVAGLPNLLSMVLLINLPIQLVLMWVLESLLVTLSMGIFMAKVFK